MSTDYVEWDKTLPGFGTRHRASGATSYIVQYREGGRGSKLRKVTLGSTGVISKDEAREAARRLLVQRKLGNVGATSSAEYFA